MEDDSDSALGSGAEVEPMDESTTESDDSSSEVSSSEDEGMEDAPVAPCPDCGRFQAEANGKVCICGLQLPEPVQPPVVPRQPPPAASASAAAAGPSASSAAPATAGPAKRKAPAKANKVQRWLMEVGRRLTGVPRFVLKDAQLIYRKALKEPKRQGCTEQGLLLASLEHALLKHQLEIGSRKALCDATAGKVSAPQLDHAAKFVAKQLASDAPLVHSLPPAAHLAGSLCDELLRAAKEGKAGGAPPPRTVTPARDALWAKAAAHTAEHAASMGLGRDYPALWLGAAISLFIFER